MTRIKNNNQTWLKIEYSALNLAPTPAGITSRKSIRLPESALYGICSKPQIPGVIIGRPGEQSLGLRYGYGLTCEAGTIFVISAV